MELVSNEFLPVILSALLSLLFIANVGRKQSFSVKTLQKSIEEDLVEPKTLHPKINPALCLACGSCVSTCPETSALGMIDGKTLLINPPSCVGHGVCKDACPNSALTLVFGTKNKEMLIPDLNSNLESKQGGLYIAGELGGVGLISIAVKQGELAVMDAIKKISGEDLYDYDIIIIGAGPSGLSAALAAQREKIRYLCIEQENFGGAIFHYPKQKLIMSKPLEFPLTGTLKFKNNFVKKEELLEAFEGIRQKVNLNIRENISFQKLEPIPNGLRVTADSESFTCKKVILCSGVGGSPIKLNVPGEDMTKVFYRLKDPKLFSNSFITVVGGGNSAVEVALELSKSELENKVTLLVRGKGFPKCHIINKTKIEQASNCGSVQIKFETQVSKIERKIISVCDSHSLESSLENDYIFILAGSQTPFKLIESLGVSISKKFGEPQEDKNVS